MSSRLAILLMLMAYALAWVASLGIENRPDPPNYSRIDEGLFQGGYVNEPPPGTHAVLNLCEFPDQYQAPVHLHVPITDASPAPTLDWLRKQVEFVDSQRRAGRTVFVHCRNGASRSAMVVIAYEMFHHGWSRDHALSFVRSRREETRPNPVFLELLGEWEQSLTHAAR